MIEPAEELAELIRQASGEFGELPEFLISTPREGMQRGMLDEYSLERPTTREELRHHVDKLYGFDFPDTPVCDGHCSPLQVLWELFTDAFTHLLIVGSRESGKTLIMAIAEHLLIRWNGDEVFHGAGIYAQAKRCFTYVQKMATNADRPWFAREVTKCIEDEVSVVGPSGKVGRLEIKSATVEQLNGPHPRAVFLDEVELIDDTALNEAVSMPLRVDGRPPVLHYTSSLKKAYGPMVRFLEEKIERGLTERRWCIESSMLVATEHGDRPIREIRAGDRVWSREADGTLSLRAVDRAERTGHRATVVVELTDGRRLRCTPDHDLLTPQGWRPAAGLHEGDLVLSDVRDSNERAEDALLFRALTRQFARRSPLRVRRAASQKIQAMQRLSAQANAANEQRARDEARRATCKGQAARDSIEGGNCGRPALASIGPNGRTAGDVRGLDRGLRSPSLAHGHRGLRLVARSERGQSRTRPASDRHLNGPRLERRHLVGAGNGVVGVDSVRGIPVRRVDRTARADVYDLSVPGTRNFIVEGIVAHNCVFEVLEQCPEERHQNGVGCNTCPLSPWCRENVRDDRTGEVHVKDGPGRAARSRGWMRIDDAISKMRNMAVSVWKSQWLSLQPQIEGLIYPAYNEGVHVVSYKYNPNLPVLAGLDFGYTNPHAVLYAQQLYDDAVVVFAEDYINMETEAQIARKIKRTPWFDNILWIAADPAAADGRATLIEEGVRTVFAADNDVEGGIDDVRWALESADLSLPPLLYFDESVVNTRREIKAYHRADPGKDLDPTEKPRKIDDHAMDALRYMIRRIFRARARMVNP